MSGELAASLWMVPWPAWLDRLLGREDKAKKKNNKRDAKMRRMCTSFLAERLTDAWVNGNFGCRGMEVAAVSWA